MGGLRDGDSAQEGARSPGQSFRQVPTASLSRGLQNNVCSEGIQAQKMYRKGTGIRHI